MNSLNRCSKAEAELGRGPGSPKTLLKRELGGWVELPAPNRARFQGVF